MPRVAGWTSCWQVVSIPFHTRIYMSWQVVSIPFHTRMYMSWQVVSIPLSVTQSLCELGVFEADLDEAACLLRSRALVRDTRPPLDPP